MAARLAENNFREAAARRAVYDSIDSRAAEIEERERALAAREQLIRALENRLEERLQQVTEYAWARRAAVGSSPPDRFLRRAAGRESPRRARRRRLRARQPPRSRRASTPRRARS